MDVILTRITYMMRWLPYFDKSIFLFGCIYFVAICKNPPRNMGPLGWWYHYILKRLKCFVIYVMIYSLQKSYLLKWLFGLAFL